MAAPDRSAIAERIGEVCRTIGFFCIVNHGGPQRLIALLLEVDGNWFAPHHD